MENPYVLIVDDDIYTISLIQNIMNKMEIDFRSIKEGKKIFDVLRYSKPDLIILDYYIPEENGLDILKKLKSIDEYKNIPVIIFTGESEKSILADFFNNGASDFINKPINFIEFEARIKSVLKVSELNRNLVKKINEITRKNQELESFSNFIADDLKNPLLDIISILNNHRNNLNEKDISKIESKVNSMLFKIENTSDLISLVKICS